MLSGQKTGTIGVLGDLKIARLVEQVVISFDNYWEGAMKMFDSRVLGWVVAHGDLRYTINCYESL